MRALVISRVYADPMARGKLRALASLGVTVSAAVPDRFKQVPRIEKPFDPSALLRLVGQLLCAR